MSSLKEQRRLHNLAKAREWKKRNSERASAYRKAYYAKNKEREAETSREYRKRPEHKEKKKFWDLSWRTKNKEKLKSKRAKPEYKKSKNLSAKNRYYSDPQYKAEKILRAVFVQAVRMQLDGRKPRSIEALIGCDMPSFIIRMEMLFKPGMSWDIRSQIHLDHIIPCSAFDLTDKSQAKCCFHYSNFQPLWRTENIKKGSKV